MRFYLAKKIMIFLGLVLIPLTQANAQSAEEYLKKIEEHTKAIAQHTNDTFTYLSSQLDAKVAAITLAAVAWTIEDTSETTRIIKEGKTRREGNQQSEAGFDKLDALILNSIKTQNDPTLLRALNTDLLGLTEQSLEQTNSQGNATSVLPSPSPNFLYGNDLLYSSLLGVKTFPDSRFANPNNDRSAYNYIKNASGLNLYHRMPGPWMDNGKKPSQLRYRSYYNTVMAIESFSAYSLSQQYADGNQFNELQTKLIQQASSETDWYAAVASEHIGWVLRQLLLYQSQLFILMTQSMQIQKQAVAAQVMTNSLLIANNAITEASLAANAAGVQLQL